MYVLAKMLSIQQLMLVSVRITGPKNKGDIIIPFMLISVRIPGPKNKGNTMKLCGLRYDGHRCARPKNHRGTHGCIGNMGCGYRWKSRKKKK